MDIATATDVSTQLLLVGFLATDPCQTALDKLQAGAPWSATGSALVFGWAPSFNVDRLVIHMAQYGRVIQSARGWTALWVMSLIA